MMNLQYEAVIGLEVHAELKTASKIFCACSTRFGASPNTQCCPICAGLPGAMPRLNRRAVELAILAGLALECEIAEVSGIDRKQYFYPDLPKAYQISQGEHPICRNGGLDITVDGGTRRVGILRIHIEEDAGKLMHVDGKTLVDYNRCGVPLIEIVSTPSVRSGREAAAYVRELRDLLVACGITDGKMQEGSLRCDVNISLRPRGTDALGVRTEIKNINSFTFIEKAIDYEIARQSALLARGEQVERETRRYDAASGKTYSMRSKEQVKDYRFLTEPDLLSIRVTREEIESLRATLPEFPRARVARLMSACGLSEYDATQLVSDPCLADYFEAAQKHTVYAKTLASLILTELLRLCRTQPFFTSISPMHVGALAELLGVGMINSSTAKKLLARLFEIDEDPREIVEREKLAQIRDPEELSAVIAEVLATNARAVNDYRRGKRAALKSLQGQVMARTAGRADPVLLERLLLDVLDHNG